VASVPISQGLISWARDTGYDYSVDDPDGASIFWNEGAEERIYLRFDDSNWVNVTEASRSGGESPFYAAYSVEVAERYLWGFFGDIFRDVKRLPEIPTPISLDLVAPPYRIKATGDGYALLDGGAPIMRARASMTKIAVLVRTSYWLRVDVEELERAYRDPNGSSLF
jgi:hypothetical protein